MDRLQRKKPSRGVTIHDVAAQAGVSHMTVSRVLNREGYVKPDTREKVCDAIRKLNYAPNAAARSLAGILPPRIGLLYDNPSTAYLSEFLLGALDESRKTDAQMIVERLVAGESSQVALDRLLASGVKGIILPPPLCESREALDEILVTGAAAVAVAPGLESASMPTVRIDNEAAGRELTNHLLSLGHRSFGVINGASNQTVSRQRLAGFLSAIALAGVSPADVRFEAGDFTYRSGLEAASRLLEGPHRPTALFAANDDMAAAALMVAHTMDLRVPGDLSIVGFDDTSIASTVWPALTTIRQPIADMARDAVDLVIREMERKRWGDGPPEQVLHEHLLIVRGSSGPAPRG
jgi:LacI family transcriptional regulator